MNFYVPTNWIIEEMEKQILKNIQPTMTETGRNIKPKQTSY